MLKTKNCNLLVLLPFDINNKKATRERLVEINMDEDRKMGIASIKNIGRYLRKFFQGSTGICVVSFFILGYCH